jgi:hypothetical protein
MNPSGTINSGANMTKQISKWWWMLDTTFDERHMVFFGASEGEVLGKYRAYMRRMELEGWK